MITNSSFRELIVQPPKKISRAAPRRALVKEKEEKGAMKGGGAQENLTAFGSIALVASLAFVMISSLSMTLWRTYKNWKNGVEAEDDQRKGQKYDDPPNPRVSGRSFAE